MSTYILVKALKRAGACVDYMIPDRVKDGYGLNVHLIDKAHEDGIDTVVTCDNGIAAIEEIAHAKELGMTVLVTDHHAVPFEDIKGIKNREKESGRCRCKSASDRVQLSVQGALRSSCCLENCHITI